MARIQSAKDRDEAEIFLDVLLADQPHRHDAAGRDRDRRAEEALEHEDALGVVAQGAVTKIGADRLRTRRTSYAAADNRPPCRPTFSPRRGHGDKDVPSSPSLKFMLEIVRDCVKRS